MKTVRNKRASIAVRKGALCLLLTIATLFLSTGRVYATDSNSSLSQTDSVFDVALVIDNSGSMKDSDPGRCAIDGAKLFVDMALYNESNIAVIKYGYQAELIGISSIETPEKKAQVKKWIDSIDYPDKNGTDTGDGLMCALDTLKPLLGNGHQKCIILFTDGDVEYVNDPDKKNNDKTKSVKKSIDQCTEVSLWGRKNNEDIPLYILGLNAKIDGKNTISGEGKERIATLSANSGGKSKVVSNVKAITPFYEEIFGKITDSEVVHNKTIKASGKEQSTIIDIPNSSVMKANLILLTNQKLTKVKLIDPDNKEVDLTDSDSLLSREKNYSMIQLIRPVKGKWKLSFVAKKGTQVIPNFFFLYDDMQSVQTIKAESEDNSNAEINQPVTVECYLKSGSARVMDKDVYADIKGTVDVINTDTDERTHFFDLVFDEDNMVMTGTFVPTKFGKYVITTELTSTSFRRTNAPSDLTVVDREPISVDKIGTISMREGETKKINLDEYFQDPDGLALHYQAEPKQGNIVDVKCDNVSGSDATLTIKGKEKGSDEILLTASDPEGNKIEVSFKVEVHTITFYVVISVIGGICGLSLLALLIFLLFRSRRLKGYFSISSFSCDGFSYGTAHINLAQSESSTYSMQKILECYAIDVQTPLNSKISPVLADSELSVILSDIILTGNLGKGYSVSITYLNGRSNSVIMDGTDLLNRKFRMRVRKKNASVPDHTLEIKTGDYNIRIVFRYKSELEM